jgi:hypothetical protein
MIFRTYARFCTYECWEVIQSMAQHQVEIGELEYRNSVSKKRYREERPLEPAKHNVLQLLHIQSELTDGELVFVGNSGLRDKPVVCADRHTTQTRAVLILATDSTTAHQLVTPGACLNRPSSIFLKACDSSEFSSTGSVYIEHARV